MVKQNLINRSNKLWNIRLILKWLKVIKPALGKFQIKYKECEIDN